MKNIYKNYTNKEEILDILRICIDVFFDIYNTVNTVCSKRISPFEVYDNGLDKCFQFTVSERKLNYFSG